jgi:glycosyltransferase involved in cell wall biosynthesis
MDYLWAGLPCVLARGDELADEFGAAGFATLVPPRDPHAVREALLRLLGEDEALTRARGAAARLAGSFEWDAAVQPLEQALAAAPPVRPLRPRASLGLLRAVGAEYLRLGRDALAT